MLKLTLQRLRESWTRCIGSHRSPILYGQRDKKGLRTLDSSSIISMFVGKRFVKHVISSISFVNGVPVCLFSSVALR